MSFNKFHQEVSKKIPALAGAAEGAFATFQQVRMDAIRNPRLQRLQGQAGPLGKDGFGKAFPQAPADSR